MQREVGASAVFPLSGRRDWRWYLDSLDGVSVTNAACNHHAFRIAETGNDHGIALRTSQQSRLAVCSRAKVYPVPAIADKVLPADQNL